MRGVVISVGIDRAESCLIRWLGSVFVLNPDGLIAHADRHAGLVQGLNVAGDEAGVKPIVIFENARKCTTGIRLGLETLVDVCGGA